jgi:hypothetical protein
MPSAPEPITAAPEVPGQPWDATSSAPVAGWNSVDGNSGPANMSGSVSGDFDSGPGPWKQT